MDLVTLDWSTEADIFTVRQRGRQVAAELGLDEQDQIRVATALSEVGRELLAGGPASVRFAVDEGRHRLEMAVTSAAQPGVTPPTGVAGLSAARRLLDEVGVVEGPRGWVITLAQNLPRGTSLDAGTVRRVRRRLAGLGPATPLEELRAQNAELVATLDQLAARQEDLLRVNGELEETNHGVLAMYAQLSQELEETNRGVVALYGELDEKGRQLVEASEAKSRFLRNISHELRTPVNSILGLVDLLAESSLDAEQRVQVDYLGGSARALLGLVTELLDLARAESGREVVRLTDVDLGELFRQLRGSLRPIAEARGLVLDIEDPEPPRLRTDAELLARVLRNLLSNALKFTETGGVRLTARRRESRQHVEFVVEDTGIGIPAELAERVFEEFFQVPGRLQAPGTGSGLGLPYARRVTETLGGTLELVSTPGGGSTFTVVLPAPFEEEEPDVSGLAVGHALVVDDDPAFRHVLRGMLQGVAARVSEAADGAEALHLLHELPADVVLLDLRMPRLDGAGTLAALRADPRRRDVPVVLLTSVDIDADVRRATEPAAALLSKDHLTRRRLLAVLGEVLGRQGADPDRAEEVGE
jgi:signal transduction histidine kinase/ActR/RegA family two-component response regulator